MDLVPCFACCAELVCRSPAMSISQEKLTCDWTAGLRLCGTTQLKSGKGIDGGTGREPRSPSGNQCGQPHD